MRFFGGNENDTSVDTMNQDRTSSNTRKFGTPLRSNVDKSQRFVQSSLKKKVRVRRTPQSKPTNNSKAKLDSSTELLLPSTGKENTIVFLPGPVGLQLEPTNEIPRYGCRVARFVDGGPNDPGQARECGGVKPGDLVLKVEAEGALLAATTYDEIINLLKLSHKKRIMTVQSVWDSKNIPEMENRDGFIPTRRNNSTTTKKRDKEMMVSTPILSQLQMNNNGTPNFTIANDMIYLPPFQSVVQSSSQEEYSETSPIRNRTMLTVAEKAPIIIPLNVESTNFLSQQCTSVASRGSSFHSQSTTESSTESMTLPSQSLADQFLLFDGFTGLFQPESSQVSSNSATSSIVSTSKVDDTDSTKYRDSYLVNAKTPDQQPQISVRGDICVNTKSQIQQQQDSFEHSLARTDFEQRLEAERAEHSKTERELKDLYIHTCERNESKIRQLVVDKDSLQKVLDEAKVEQTLLTDTRFKESERQIAELERIRTRIEIETGAKIKDLTNEYSRKMVTKEEQWSGKYGGLEDETNDLRETLESKLMELDMSRTMITEMESRILAAEGEKDDFSNRLQDAHKSIEELENSIRRNKKVEEINSKEMLEKVMNVNQGLAAEVESYESFKEESTVLTEKLVNSVQEKQKVINESQSFVFKLETENENLTKQIDDKTNDVEQLLQEKLLLEDKLAQTWKDHRKAKDDASSVHEFLLEKLENGEYFTSADIEEREITIQSLSSELKRVKKTLKDDLHKSIKRSVDLHILLRGVEVELLERKESNIKISMERDLSKKRIDELEENLDSAKNQIVMVTETHDNQKTVVNKLKEQAESISRSKEEATIYHQRSINSISSKLEGTKSELLLCHDRLEKIQSLKDDEVATNGNLRAQVEVLSSSNEQTKTQYQKSIESISSSLESKKSELLSCQNRLTEIHLLKEKEAATNENLKAQVELVTESKVEVEVQYQKTIELVSSELEAKKSELLFCQDKLEEMQSLKDVEVATSENLRAQVEELSSSNERTKKQYQKSIESISSGLESKRGELISCQNRLEEIHLLKEKETAAKENLKAQVELITESKVEAEVHYQKSIELISSELEVKKSKFVSCQNRLEEIQCLKEDELATNDNLRAQVEALLSSKKETKLQYQKIIESVSSELESKTSELLSCHSRLEDIHSLKEKEMTTNEDLKAQVESVTESKREAEVQYKKSFKSISLKLEAKKSEFLLCQNKLDEMTYLKEDEVTINANLRAKVEALSSSEEETKLQYKKSIESVSSGLESKKNELLSCQNRLEEIHVLKEKEMATNEDLKAQIDSITESNREVEIQYQKLIESISLNLEAKESDLLSCRERLNEAENAKASFRNSNDELKQDLQAEVQSQKRKVNSIETQRDRILDELNQLKTREEYLQQEVDHLETTIDQSEQELLSVKAGAKDLFRDCANLKTTGNDLERTISSLVDEKDRMTSDYQEDIDKNKIQLEAKEEAVASLKEAETQLQKRVNSLNVEKERTVNQSEETIRTFEAGLQSQYEELSCTEMRLQILEEDYNFLKSAQDKSLEEIDILILEKKNVESEHQETITKLNLELQSKQGVLESTKEVLQQSIGKLSLESNEAGLRYREDMEELTTKLELGKSELFTTQTQLKNIQDTDLIAMEGLHTLVHSLTSKNEIISTQYWESMQELTTELQFETEKVSHKQSRLDDLEEEIQSYKTSLQEINQHNFQDLRATIDSQTRLLDCSEFEKSKMGELNSALESTIIDLQNRLSESSSAYSILEVNMYSLSHEKTKTEEFANLQQERHRDETKYLQSKIMSMGHSMQRLKMGNCGLQIKQRALMQDANEKLELQKKCDDLSASIAKVGVSNEKVVIDYCSEIFRLVKRLAVFEATHAEINEQRKKAIAIASKQCVQQEEEQLLSVELAQKTTKQLQFQNVMTSSLQVELSSTLLLVKDLEDSKEIEFNGLKAIIAGLHSELSSEKIAKTQSAADAFDEKMNLKILDNKYSLMLQSKDEALLRSENTRTTMARNLHDANTDITSLRVQLKEKDHKIEDALYDLQQTKVAANHKLDSIIESKTLRLELEKTTRTMLDLKLCLREAEDSAVKAQEFLTVMQSHLKEKITTQATEIGSLLDHNSSLKDEKLSTDELLEKSKNDVKLLHQTIDELRRELVDKGQNMDKLTEKLKDKRLSSCRLNRNLQQAERNYQRHFAALKCHILSSRAAYINQNSQSKKDILKLRVHYVSKYLQNQTLEKKIAYFHQKENIAKEKIDDVNEVNASLKGEMEEMRVTINENKHQFENLQKAMGALKANLLIQEGNDKESKSRKKSESKEKTQLLKNIECISTRLISMEESQRQSADFEESLKKNISKLRAEYISKHLEVVALKKKYVILCHSNKSVEKKNTELNATMNELKVRENNNCILLENREKALASFSSEFDQLKVEKKSLEENHARFQEELKLSLSTKDNELTKLHQASLELKDRLEIVTKQANEHEVIRKDEAERTAILEEERNTMAETISKNDGLLAEYSSSLESERSRFNVLLSQKNESFSAAITERNRCQESLDKRQNDFAAAISEKEGLENQRRQLAIDYEISQHEVNDIQKRFCQAEGMNKILRDNADDARKTIIELEKIHHTRTIVQEELQRLQTQCDGKEHHILQLEDEIRSLREDLVEEPMTESERDLQNLKDQVVNRECRIANLAMLVQLTASLPGPKSNDEQTVRYDSPVFDDVMSDHLNSVKDAFQKQKLVLDDVKLSEMVLQNFMDEAMELSTQAEAEMLELSSSIGTVDDLLLNPSRLLASLDLAGLDSSKSYFDEVRSRLEDMASLAYTTGLELKNRKKELLHWRSNRTECPAIPVTPPSSKHMKNVIFDVNDLEPLTDNTPITTNDILRNKVAGARLLCCVMEKRNRTDLASTLRKWTALTYLTNASSSHKETAIKLAHQLEITREKLLVLKSNLKGQRKPKLRRILEQLENTQHECSFEI